MRLTNGNREKAGAGEREAGRGSAMREAMLSSRWIFNKQKGNKFIQGTKRQSSAGGDVDAAGSSVYLHRPCPGKYSW